MNFVSIKNTRINLDNVLYYEPTYCKAETYDRGQTYPRYKITFYSLKVGSVEIEYNNERDRNDTIKMLDCLVVTKEL